MFKSWSKKKKVKALFKLEFQATEVRFNWFRLILEFYHVQFGYAVIPKLYMEMEITNVMGLLTSSAATTSYLASYLHFQVPKMKKSALMISLVPEDVGKPTVRLEKAAVQDGTCSWENPVFETVKLIRESKTGKLHEKIYHFIVSTVWKWSQLLTLSALPEGEFS